MESDDKLIDAKDKRTPRKQLLADRLAGGGFLSRWQQDRLHQDEEHAEIDDDDEADDDETSEKGTRRKGRLQRMAGSILDRLVTRREAKKPDRPLVIDSLFDRPESPTTPADQAEAATPQLPTLDILPSEAADQLPDLTDEAESSGLSRLEMADDIEPIPDDETSNTEAGGASFSAETADDEEEESPATAQTANASAVGGGRGATPPPTSRAGGGTPPNPPTPPPTGPGGVAFGSGPNPNAALTNPNTVIINNQEHIIEHQGNRLAGLVGLGVVAEYFGRRRAVAKQERLFDKKLEVETKQAEEQKARLQVQIDHLARQSRDEAAQVVAREQRFERQIKTISSNKESVIERGKPEKAPKKLEKLEREPALEKTSQSRLERLRNLGRPEIVAERPILQPLQHPERVFAKERQPVQLPEAINQAAAERQPKEELYERRHEIKDDSAAFAGQAASVGSILAGQTRQPLANPVSTVTTPFAAPQAPASRQRLAGLAPQTTKQAVTMGLWGGLIVVILGALIYFLA